ncbi:MAG: hypothetical protein KF753_09630 [Caldilineaceae bacterium]|nr:hypothetical protein [Caldilineaceae bacterium]
MFGNQSKRFKVWTAVVCFVLMAVGAGAPLLSSAESHDNPTATAFWHTPLPQEGGGDGFTG